MPHTHYPFKKAAEKRFPFRVDVPAPSSGPGMRLIDMLVKCRERLGPAAQGRWAWHGHSEVGEPSQPRRDYARFYFMSNEDAEAFRRVWLDVA